MTKEFSLLTWLGRQKNSIPLVEPHIPSEVNSMIVQQQNRYKSYLIDPRPENEDPNGYDWRLREQVAAYGKQVGERLDALSQAEKQAYVLNYCKETGFPDTKITSKKIETHLKDALFTESESLGLTLAYAGYARTCSVGRGLALPGSDVDFLTIVVRENDADLIKFDRNLIRRLNPRLVDVGNGFGIFTLEKVNEFTAYLKAHDNHLGYEDFEELYKIGWSEAKIYNALDFVTNVRTEADLVNTLDDAEVEKYSEVRDETVEQRMALTTKRNKSKHEARRELIQAFPYLSTDEQFTIIRTLQIHAESLALDISDTSPHTNTIQSLIEKELLIIEKNNIKAEWGAYPWLFRNIHFWFYPNSN